MGHLPFLALLALAAGLPLGGHGAGEESASMCPKLDDVVAGLGQVISGDPRVAATAGLVIRDHGTTWDVELRGRSASYADPARDCEERTRIATVFAALVLEPPDHAESLPPVAAEPAATPRKTRAFLFELGPVLGLAVGAGGNTPVGIGGQARAGLLAGRLGLSMGAELIAFSELDLGPYGATMGRGALDLSARVAWRAGPVHGAMDLGPYLAWLRVRGSGLLDAHPSDHVDVGARAAVSVRLGASRVAPFVALQGEVAGRRIDLTVDPGGSIGQVPRLWLGLVLGASLAL